MKRFSIFLALIGMILLVACQKPQPPVFKTIENLKLNTLTQNGVDLTGVLVFDNPNSIALDLLETDLDIIIEGKNLGKVKQIERASILVGELFKVPIAANLEWSSLKDSWMQNALNVFLNKKVNAEINGFVKIQGFKVPLKIPVNFVKEIELKK